MPLLFYLGTFPHPSSAARCRLPSCRAPDAVFVVVKWRGVALLCLCPQHAAVMRDAIGEGTDRRGGPLVAALLEPVLTHGEHRPANFTHPVLGCDRVVPVLVVPDSSPPKGFGRLRRLVQLVR
jgi:hypothetical protein